MVYVAGIAVIRRQGTGVLVQKLEQRLAFPSLDSSKKCDCPHDDDADQGTDLAIKSWALCWGIQVPQTVHHDLDLILLSLLLYIKRRVYLPSM